jgi:hypothetical protein
MNTRARQSQQAVVASAPPVRLQARLNGFNSAGRSVYFARLHHDESLLLRRRKMSYEQGCAEPPCQGSAIDALRSIARVTKPVESFNSNKQTN